MKNSRTWAEIDTSALQENFITVNNVVGDCLLMPVIKADGYGLGGLEIAHSLQKAGATYVAVSCLDEAKVLIDTNLAIVLLGASLPSEVEEIVKLGLVATVQSLSEAEYFNSVSADMRVKTKIHLKIDTGMGRFGIPVQTAFSTIKKIAQLTNLQLDGIFSHLAVSRSLDEGTFAQINSLRKLIIDLDAEGIHFCYRHIANSTAIAGIKEVSLPPFNMVRSGIDIYGGHLSLTERHYLTKPVLSLKARLLSVRRMSIDSTIGYGRTYKVKHNKGELIGVVSIGYADGYYRCLSNNSDMLVHGKRCPVIGLVCMDYTMISLEGVPDAKAGDEVVIIGSQENENITLSELARAAKTIPYEFMCGLGSRVKLKYLP